MKDRGEIILESDNGEHGGTVVHKQLRASFRCHKKWIVYAGVMALMRWTLEGCTKFSVLCYTLEPLYLSVRTAESIQELDVSQWENQTLLCLTINKRWHQIYFYFFWSTEIQMNNFPCWDTNRRHFKDSKTAINTCFSPRINSFSINL